MVVRGASLTQASVRHVAVVVPGGLPLIPRRRSVHVHVVAADGHDT
jgi:hypothetical protein